MTASPEPGDRRSPADRASLARAAPLRLPPPSAGWKGAVAVLFGVVALGAILVACAVYTAPALVSDWQVQAAARPVADARVSEGKCTSKILLHICDVTLGLRTPTGPVSRRVNYVFTGVHVGDYGIRVMADPARPELVTTDLGLDRLWNRTLTLLVLAGALAACIVGALGSLARNRAAA